VPEPSTASEATPDRVDYNSELQRLNEQLRRALSVEPSDHVLDIGCGAGLTTREAALLASRGTALGVDVSAAAIAQARELASAEGPPNVSFEHADAQSYGFAPGHFDVAISRFGTMFFDDPVEAFRNIAHALRPSGRLTTMVWQSRERNEWAVAIRRALTGDDPSAAAAGATSSAPDAFSLGDPSVVSDILEAAGFVDVTFANVHEPVYYGPDVDAAMEWVRGFSTTTATLDRLDRDGAEAAVESLHRELAEHATDDGVWLDSRAWIVDARRR
jgi:SAM-dependent methyltransferase